MPPRQPRLAGPLLASCPPVCLPRRFARLEGVAPKRANRVILGWGRPCREPRRKACRRKPVVSRKGCRLSTLGTKGERAVASSPTGFLVMSASGFSGSGTSRLATERENLYPRLAPSSHSTAARVAHASSPFAAPDRCRCMAPCGTRCEAR